MALAGPTDQWGNHYKGVSLDQQTIARIGDDQDADVVKVEHANKYTNTTTNNTFTLSAVKCYVHAVVINTGVAGATVTLYDDNDPVAGGLTGAFAIIDASAPVTLWYGLRCTNGLCAVVASGGAAPNVTFIYRN